MKQTESRFSLPAKVLITRQLLWGASFYGIYVLLTRFFLDELNYSEADTLMMLGAFGAVGPVFSVLGGLAADRFIGAFRSVWIGYSFYTVGFLLLGVGASSQSIPMSLFSIALIGYSRGLSAASPTVLLGRSFGENKRDVFQEALTINYAINNLGSFVATYGFPFLVAYYGYQGNFYICTALMAINMVLFFVFREQLRNVGNEIDRRPVSIAIWAGFIVASIAMLGSVFWIFDNLEMGRNALYALGCGAIIYFLFEIYKANSVERWKMGAVLVFMTILIIFYFYYGQMKTSMNLYAINLMGENILGFIPIKPEANSAFNPLWCFVMGAPIMFVYSWLEKKGINPSIPTKFSVAFLFTAAAFLLLGMSTGFMDEAGQIAAEWIVIVHLFQAIAELIVGALGAGFIFEMVPKRLSGFAVGLRAVTLSLSGIFAAVISTRIALPRDITLTTDVVQNVYGSFFYNLGYLALAMAAVALVLSKVISKMVARSDAIAAGEVTARVTMNAA